MKFTNAFTLIELLLVLIVLSILVTSLVINFDTLVGNKKYYEARENLKTFLINLKYQALFQQKEFELTLDENNNIYSNFNDNTLLSAITNDLKILEFSSNKITFFIDGSVQESYIVISNTDNTITNKIIINVIGNISYEEIKNEF
jgi:prepilin-type N-terminal cleavage/methylation domain-containing protein